MPTIYIPSAVRPSYQSGYAPRNGPPLNPGQWQGLKAAWAPSLGVTGLNLFDIAGGNTGVLNGATWAVGPDGPGIITDGAQSVRAANLGITGDFTWVIDFVVLQKLLTSGGSIGGQFADSESARALTGNVDWGLLYTGSGVLRGRIVLTNTNYNIDAAKTPAVGERLHIALVRNGTTGLIYLNGKQAGSTAMDSSATDADHSFKIGSENAAANEDAGQLTLSTSVHNRALTPSEITKLFEDRYALLRPAPMPIVVSAAAPSFVPYPHVPGMTGGIAV